MRAETAARSSSSDSLVLGAENAAGAEEVVGDQLTTPRLPQSL